MSAIGHYATDQYDSDLDGTDYEDDYVEPVGSCDDCGSNIYADEDDGLGLCDQCSWGRRPARPRGPESKRKETTP